MRTDGRTDGVRVPCMRSLHEGFRLTPPRQQQQATGNRGSQMLESACRLEV